MKSATHLVILILMIITRLGFAEVTEWVDITLEHGHIKVPVTVNGVEGTALLDTGSQTNAINERFAEKHKDNLIQGRKFIISGAYGTEKKTSYNNVPITLFGADFKVDSVVPLKIGSSLFLLGSGFFSNFIFQFDYPNNRMRLITRDSMNLRELQNIKMKVIKQGSWPIVILDLDNKKKVHLIMDTGSNGGLLIKRSIAEDLGWLEKHPSISVKSRGVNTTSMIDRFNIPSLKFGPFVLENVITSVPSEGEKFNIDFFQRQRSSRFNVKSIQGIIGYDILKHFVLTLDYKKGYMHVGLPEEIVSKAAQEESNSSNTDNEWHEVEADDEKIADEVETDEIDSIKSNIKNDPIIAFVSYSDLDQRETGPSKLRWGIAISRKSITFAYKTEDKTYNEPTGKVSKLNGNLLFSNIKIREKVSARIQPGVYDWLIILDKDADGIYDSYLGTIAEDVTLDKMEFKKGFIYKYVIDENAKITHSVEKMP
jgi:Aspartyl protease/gag-polyprotein putative aspartyl protease